MTLPQERSEALVSIVIPNWNGREHLPVCLSSIKRQTFKDFAVTLVDNGSIDGAVKFVREHFPSTTIIALTENVGFAKAVNVGIRSAATPFVALINNDIELDDRWLEKLVNALKSAPEAGSVACKMLNFYRRDIIDAAGDEMSRNGNAGGRGHGCKDGPAFSSNGFVFGACAGAALYRRSVFDRVGLFDEDFFAWYEDVDLDLRMQLQGFRCLYVPAAVCFHKRGGTVQKMNALSVRLHVRNNLLYVTKNFPVALLVRKSPRIVVSRFKTWIEHMREGNGSAVRDALLEFVRMLPSTLRKRRAIQKARTVSLSYLSSLFRGMARTENEGCAKP